MAESMEYLEIITLYDTAKCLHELDKCLHNLEKGWLMLP